MVKSSDFIILFDKEILLTNWGLCFSWDAMGLVPKVLDSESELGHSLFILWDTVKYYPAWLYNGYREHVWPQVHVAIGGRLDDRQDIVLRNGNTLTFTSQSLKTDRDSLKHNLEIYCNKRIVASLYTQIVAESHTLAGVEFINDGVWTRELLDFLEWKKGYDEKTKKEIID